MTERVPRRFNPQLKVTQALSVVYPYEFALLPEYIEELYDKLRIAVIYGGDKDKDGAVIYKTVNPRAWKSYEAVARDIQGALLEVGFEHVYLMPDDMTLPRRLQEAGIHLAWLNTGGVQGYNPVSHTPGMLEMMGIPYVGHNPFDAAMLDNKHAFKRELHHLGIDTAPFMTWHPVHGWFDLSENSRFAMTFGGYDGPFVVKPVSGRASLYVEVVETAADLPRVTKEIFRVTSNTVLIEKYLPGREFAVAVCGSVVHAGDTFFKLSTPFAFSTIERIFEPDERIFMSMDQKAITRSRARAIGDDEAELRERLLALGQSIYWDLGLQSLIRVDVREDSDGRLYVLEANPKPDLKRPEGEVTSLIFIGLEDSGLSYNDLILSLLADRLDYLFMYNIGMILPIIELLL